MNHFIAKSESSKKLLNIAQISVTLPVNILIIGEKGVGKKILARDILSGAFVFQARKLEEALINKTKNTEEFSQLILTNIEEVKNKKEFLQRLKNVKIVATTSYLCSDVESSFAVKLHIPPLKKREEDLQEITKLYLQEIQDIYDLAIDPQDIDIDLSQNGISLKKSIFKNSILKSLSDQDMLLSLEEYLLKKLQQQLTYKELLEYFEIPLLKAAKKEYSSQLQMANNLQINRITLRKKIEQYSEKLDI